MSLDRVTSRLLPHLQNKLVFGQPETISGLLVTLVPAAEILVVDFRVHVVSAAEDELYLLSSKNQTFLFMVGGNLHLTHSL